LKLKDLSTAFPCPFPAETHPYKVMQKGTWKRGKWRETGGVCQLGP